MVFSLDTKVGHLSMRCELLALRALKFLDMIVAREAAMTRVVSVTFSRSVLKKQTSVRREGMA